MGDYDLFCGRVSKLQAEENELDKYLKWLGRLKESKFNPFTQEDKTIDLMMANLVAKKAEVETKYNEAYDVLLEEADVIVKSAEACIDCNSPSFYTYDFE